MQAFLVVKFNLELVKWLSTNFFFSPIFRHCNRVQEKRGAVYDKVTAIHKEIQQTRFKIQQLNENAEKEEMKAKVRGFPKGIQFGILKTDF